MILNDRYPKIPLLSHVHVQNIQVRPGCAHISNLSRELLFSCDKILRLSILPDVARPSGLCHCYQKLLKKGLLRPQNIVITALLSQLTTVFSTNHPICSNRP